MIIFFLSLLSVFSLSAKISFTGGQSSLLLSGSSARLCLNRNLENVGGNLVCKNIAPQDALVAGNASLISFLQGRVITEEQNLLLSGQIDLADNFKIIGQGQTLELDHDLPAVVSLSGANNTLLGSPRFAAPTVLADHTTAVDLDLQSVLNQNIELNGGQVKLLRDLKLHDNVGFVGDGTIDINNRTLTLPTVSSHVWSGNLNFINANAIQNQEYFVTLTGTWSFSGGATSHLYGKGGIVDMSGGGIISVAASHNLYIFGLHLLGLGSGGGSFSLASATTSSITLSAVTLDFASNYTWTGGNLICEGERSQIMFRNGSKLTLSGANARLTIDGMALEYDSLTTGNSDFPIVTTGGAQVIFLNGGTIRPSGSYLMPNAMNFDAVSTTLYGTVHAGTANGLLFTNTTGLAKAMSVDGQNNSIIFYNGTNASMTLQQLITLTTTNVSVKNFDPAQISRQGSGGSQAIINFGSNTNLYLEKNLTVSSEIAFTDSGVIEGGGCVMTLSVADSITIDGASSVLELRNLTLNVNNLTAIRAKTATSKIILNNCRLVISSNNWTWSTGSLDIVGNTFLVGRHSTDSHVRPVFTFASSGLLTIKAGASLTLGSEVVLRHAPNTSGDGGVLSVQRRHFVLEATSSILQAGFAAIQVGPNGLALDRGIFRLWADVAINRDVGQANSALVLGTALSVQPGQFALDADCPIFYTPST